VEQHYWRAETLKAEKGEEDRGQEDGRQMLSRLRTHSISFLRPLGWLYRFSAIQNGFSDLAFGLVWKVMSDGGLEIVVLARLA
jgi:hypothetical protein